MNSSTFSSNAKDAAPSESFRWPVACLMTLCAIALVETVAANWKATIDRDHLFLPPDRVPSFVESVVDTKLNVASQSGPTCKVLILGDSSGLMGVDPRVVQESTGRSCYNLCTISMMGVEGHLLILKQFVKTHGNPSTLVYHFAPMELKYTKQEIVDWKFLQHVERWCAATNQTSPSALPESESLSVLPSMTFRDQAQLLLSVRVPEKNRFAEPRQKWPSHNETVALLKSQSGFMKEQEPFATFGPMKLEPTLSAYHKQTLEKLFQFAEQQGIAVRLVSNPLPNSAKTPVTENAVKLIERQLSKIYGQYPHVEGLISQRYYDNTGFAIVNHLTPTAAIMNSEQIAFALKQE